MIKRQIAEELDRLLDEYPVVTILGPRQAGKTTLAKGKLVAYEYTDLESPETRQYAQDDPKAFLAQFKGSVILDEIQRVPELLSYIQMIVDANQRNWWERYSRTYPSLATYVKFERHKQHGDFRHTH